MTNLRIVFDQLAPLLNGIHSLTFDQNGIPLIEQYFAQKLAQIKMLDLGIDFYSEPFDQATINFCMNWLTSEERESSEPAFLNIYTQREIFYQFCMAIKEVY